MTSTPAMEADMKTEEHISDVAERVVENVRPEEKADTIREAVCAVMAELRRLEKADTNKFANYDFTSVDDFKDEIRPLMAKHGLFLHIAQDVFVIERIKDGKGKETTFARFDFLITLKHVSGDEEPAELITVMLPFTGAQTSGAARSYAIKEWMKSRFLASSGDTQEEADLLDNSRDGMRLSKQDARKLYDDLNKELKESADGRNHDALAVWWSGSKERLDSLPRDWFLTIKNDYAETWKDLKAQADLDGMSNEQLDRLAQGTENADIINHPLNAG